MTEKHRALSYRAPPDIAETALCFALLSLLLVLPLAVHAVGASARAFGLSALWLVGSLLWLALSEVAMEVLKHTFVRTRQPHLTGLPRALAAAESVLVMGTQIGGRLLWNLRLGKLGNICRRVDCWAGLSGADKRAGRVNEVTRCGVCGGAGDGGGVAVLSASARALMYGSGIGV